MHNGWYYFDRVCNISEMHKYDTSSYYRSPSVEEEINNSKVNLKNYMR